MREAGGTVAGFRQERHLTQEIEQVSYTGMFFAPARAPEHGAKYVVGLEFSPAVPAYNLSFSTAVGRIAAWVVVGLQVGPVQPLKRVERCRVLVLPHSIRL